MYPDQTMWWPMSGMWIFPLMFFAVIIFAVFMFAGRCGARPPWSGPGRHHSEGGESESALDIVKKRYSKGEITRDEFEQMKKDILD